MRRIKHFFFFHGSEGPKAYEVNESPNVLKVNVNQWSAAILQSDCRCRFIFPDLFGILCSQQRAFQKFETESFYRMR